MTLRLFAPAPALALAFTLAAPAVVRAETDPAAQTVASLNDGLIAVMKTGGSVSARLPKAEAAVSRAFDTAAMTRTAVGPAWTGFAAADQAALTKAFGRFTAATYAKNFDGYDGERFTIDPKVDTRGPDKLVKSTLVPKSGASTGFVYRLRQSGGAWKIIDVFYNSSISQLAAQRSQFAASLSQGGPTALVKSLNDKTDQLLK